MIPVVVAVVYPLAASVAGLLYHPWTVGVLGLVVDAGKELLHVVVGIVDIVGAAGGILEEIYDVYRPITCVNVVGRGGGFFPSLHVRCIARWLCRPSPSRSLW